MSERILRVELSELDQVVVRCAACQAGALVSIKQLRSLSQVCACCAADYSGGKSGGSVTALFDRLADTINELLLIGRAVTIEFPVRLDNRPDPTP